MERSGREVAPHDADPQRELSCALLTSGKPFLGTHLIAFWKLLASIAKSVPS